MDHYIEDKTVIITGGSSGFGLETARILLEMNVKVVITGRDQDRLDKAAQQLNHDNLLAVRADATSTEDWITLIDAVHRRFEKIDVLVNNHGAGCKVGPIDQLSDDDIQQILDINLSSVIKGSRQIIEVMKSQGCGHIVNVSSACARYSWPGWATYTAAKAGLVAFTKCLHLEMAQWGGKATSFIPGAARTGFCQAAGIEDDWMGGFPDAYEFARTLVHCIDVPDNCVIQDVTIWGVKQISEMVTPF